MVQNRTSKIAFHCMEHEEAQYALNLSELIDNFAKAKVRIGS